ncbi:hypothetical protein [Piscibacillus salipiscarius]|uniref:hypothetical protein n=1 Tax=Piscibacillus salipiscarius TaxID=299480 RepID=UPI002436982E|nr:hypothetical protein [Piscibacillus salipiscarius]
MIGLKNMLKAFMLKKTYNNYMEKLNNYILPRFGAMRIEQIKTLHIVDFLNEASQPGFGKRKKDVPLSSSTIYELDKILRILFNKAVTWQIISKSPMESLERPKLKNVNQNSIVELTLQLILKHLTKNLNSGVYFS